MINQEDAKVWIDVDVQFLRSELSKTLMATVRNKIERELDPFIVGSSMNRAILENIFLIENALLNNTPFKTGFLRSSFGVDDRRLVFSYDASYAGYVADNTGFITRTLNEITPIFEKALINSFVRNLNLFLKTR